MDRGFKALKTAALVLLGRLDCLFDDVDALNDDGAFLGLNAQDTTGLVAVFALTNLDGIATFDVQRGWLSSPYSTSGAREMIFIKRRSRSSRATGPKTRVPRGSP